MNFFQAVILGIIQGLTEFIPVSSTAHLLIGQTLLGMPSDDKSFAFNVIIQLGTVLAMLIYFWNDLFHILRSFVLGIWHRKPFETHDSLLGWLVIVATVPALIVGFLVKDLLADMFNTPILVAGMRLVLTALVLTVVERIGRRQRNLESASWMDAVTVGLFQILSIFPGASRSGSTIAGGILRGFDRPSAARLAFLMSAPILTAAGTYETLRLVQMPGTTEFLPYLAVGFITAGVIGWLSIKWLIQFLRDHSLYIFAVYCAVVGLICLGFSLL
jgi:undecaprenyl-diphosphatase